MVFVENTKKKKKLLNRKKKQLIFYICIVALPILQFCVFYIGVNFNSILLAFKTFDADTNKYVFDGFNNFLIETIGKSFGLYVKHF